MPCLVFHQKNHKSQIINPMWWAALFSGENGKLIRNLVIGSIILTIIVVVIVIIVAKSKAAKNKRENAEKIKQYEDEIDPSNLTFSESEYSDMADKIDNAMGNWFEDDDEEAVYEVLLQLRTNSDMLKLQSAFGVRHGDTLKTYIQDHFNGDEIQKCNNILADRNISLRF